MELLAQVGLAEQANINLVETPKAAATLVDLREGTAGLALVGVAPVADPNGQLLGLALSLHLFNNDFTLVDEIKNIAQIDTVTIFLGDMRVSTNVMTTEGNRAVGTRLASEVGDVVLKGGQEYVGTAFVVNENYITRYIAENAQRIAGLGRQIYERLADMGGHLARVGRNLGQATCAYNAAMGSLESRVLVSARMLKELEAAGPDDVVPPLEPVDREPRRLAAPELVGAGTEDDDPVPGRAAAR